MRVRVPPLALDLLLARPSEGTEALNLGAYDVVAKPFDPHELIGIVSLAWATLERQILHQPAESNGGIRNVMNAMN